MITYRFFEWFECIAAQQQQPASAGQSSESRNLALNSLNDPVDSMDCMVPYANIQQSPTVLHYPIDTVFIRFGKIIQIPKLYLSYRR